ACSLLFAPPRVDLIAVKRRVRWSLELVPISEPLLWQIEQRHDIVAREKEAVERSHRGVEPVAVLRFEQGLDHGVDAGALYPCVVERAVSHRSVASPAESLLVAGRQRHRPIVLDHVEVIVQLAPLKLSRVDLADLRVDADVLQGASISEQQPLLCPGCGEDLEGDGLAGLVAELAAFEPVSGLLEKG